MGNEMNAGAEMAMFSEFKPNATGSAPSPAKAPILRRAQQTP
jgi:hypothetical protein